MSFLGLTGFSEAGSGKARIGPIFMRIPTSKKRNRMSPEVLDCREYLRDFAGRLYEEPKPCPFCGSENRVKNGRIERLLCKLIADDGGFEDVFVEVQRFICKDCRNTYTAGPFYPECLYGSPVVDLCLYLAASNPYNRVEKILTDFGIQVDRDTVREYAMKFEERLEELAGIKFMGESLGVNFVKALFDCGTIEELKGEHGEEFFESCSDETYPAKKGAKKEMKEENRRRKARGEKKIPYPEGFCAAFSYIPSHNFFASSVIRNFDFNFLLAKALLAPTQGVDWRVMDGHPSYQDFEHWNCLLHLFRSGANKDETLKLLKEELPHLVPDYLSEKYEEFQREKLELLKEERSRPVRGRGVHRLADN